MNRPVAGTAIAEELEISLRTLYRDMASLESTGVPVRGEAGVGYILEDGYDVPPLMFSVAELEALMLGARMMDGRVDTAMSTAVQDALAKIAAVVPAHLKERLVDTPLFAPTYQSPPEYSIEMQELRGAMGDELQLHICYRDLKGNESKRVVWPVLLSFFQNATVLVAWCTLREDFRSFRLDNISSLEVLGQKLPRPRKTLFAQWRRRQLEQIDRNKHWRDRAGKIYGV